MRTWLLLDVSFICWRNFHAIGNLEYDGIKTGVVYGLLRDMQKIGERYASSHFVFCFDAGKPLRTQILPTYKHKRQEQDEEKQKQREEVREQVRLLREDYLPTLGYNNVFSASGYEADDLIAGVCHKLPPGDNAVIVSKDSDLYQLLDDKVIIWTTDREITKQSLLKQTGLSPEQHMETKAIAGCTSDNIPGVPGVGEVTAAKYLLGNLKESTLAWRNIDCNESLIERNRQLVKLPYPNTPVFALEEDNVPPPAWQQLFKRLGIKSLSFRVPQRIGF